MGEHLERIYWDTSVWCEWVRDDFGLQEVCRQIIAMAERGKIEIVVSPLVVAEFAPLDESVDSILDNYLQRSSFIRVQFSWPLAVRARGFVRTYGLRGLDAGHLACAKVARVNSLHTLDNKLLQVPDEAVGMRICKPEWKGQLGLALDL